MSSDIDFLVVEDELLIAENIAALLAKAGHTRVRMAATVEEALREIEIRKPGMVLTDIDLGEGKSGIDLGGMLQNTYGIPFIYITSHSSPGILDRAKHTRPNAYIVKPFKKEDLLVAIELAQFNSNTGPATGQEQIVIKEGRAMIRLNTAGIQWLENEGNYTTIFMEEQKRRVVRSSLSELEEQLPVSRFVRIHKSYVVNKAHVKEVRPNSVLVGDKEFPVGRTYQPAVKAFFK